MNFFLYFFNLNYNLTVHHLFSIVNLELFIYLFFCNFFIIKQDGGQVVATQAQVLLT